MNLMMVKLILVVVGLLGIGLWQLYDVNRELKKHGDADESSPAAPDSRTDDR